MIWYKTLSGIEIFFITLFIVFYLSYIYRVLQIGKVLKTNFRTVITKLLLRTVYFILFIIALLGPSFGDTTREVKSVGKDILLCIDLSESMNAFDIQPSRLEKVKFELKSIVSAFSSDRIGLIIFSSEAFMQCPLTYDQNALNLFIETLSTRLVPNTGTDFAPPLKMTIQKLKNEDGNPVDPKSKIIILISDGEDFGKKSDEVVSQIEEMGIKLYTVGIGTKKGSRIRTDYGFKTDKTGKEVISKLNARELKTLAIKTGGKYFEINNEQNDTERLINTINQIEGQLRDTRKMDVSANKYYYFIALALLLIAIDVLISLKVIKI